MRLARRRTPSTTPAPRGPAQAALEATSEQARQFIELFVRLYERLVAYAGRLVDLETARDAVCDVFADLWRRWAQLTEEQRADKYVFGAVRNKALDARAAHDAEVSFEDEDDGAEAEINRRVVSELQRPSRGDTVADVLDLTLAAMPRKRRAVVLLVHGEDFSHKEAAKALGVSVGTINTHMRLGMENLRAAFTSAGFQLANPTAVRLLSLTRGSSHD